MTDQDDHKELGKNLLRRLEVKRDSLGEALSELNELARDRLQHDSCEEAFQCCKVALDLCIKLKLVTSDVDTSYAEAVFYTYMGTSYLNQGKLELAVDCYRKSITHFRVRYGSWNEGLLWIMIGKLHRFTGELEDAFFAFQRSI